MGAAAPVTAEEEIRSSKDQVIFLLPSEVATATVAAVGQGVVLSVQVNQQPLGRGERALPAKEILVEPDLGATEAAVVAATADAEATEPEVADSPVDLGREAEVPVLISGGGAGGGDPPGNGFGGGPGGSGGGARNSPGGTNTGGGGGAQDVGGPSIGAGGSGVVLFNIPSSLTAIFDPGLTYSSSVSGGQRYFTVTQGTGNVFIGQL